MSTAADEFLTGSGVPSAKFESVNDRIIGTVTEPPEVKNQTDFKTGEVITWKDGSPRKQLVVTLQTELRDGPDDDGRRRLYVKGKALTDAVREAVRKVGAKGLEVGGQLKVAYVGDGEVPGRGLNAPKLYMAEYTRPTQQGGQDFFAQQGQPPAAQQSAQQSAQQTSSQSPTPPW